MRKYTAKNQQLDEINFKKIANFFKGDQLARDKNKAAREKLKKQKVNLYGEIQNFLGLRGLDIEELTPKLLTKFLTSYDIQVDPKSIPVGVDGTVELDVLDQIVNDLTIKSLGGEELTYEPPQNTRALGSNRSNPALNTNTQTTPAPSSNNTSGSDFFKSWTTRVKSAVDDDAKADLARELASFLVQNPSNVDDLNNMISGKSNSASSKPKNVAKNSSKATKASSRTSTSASNTATPPSNTATPPSNTATPPSNTATPPSKATKASSRTSTSASNTATPPSNTSNPPAANTAPAEPKANAAPKPRQRSNRKPSEKTPIGAMTSSSKEKKPPKVTKNSKGVSIPNAPWDKNESIQRISKAIKEGKKFKSGLKMSSYDYKYFIKILETMNFTLKDIGLWRVLKESNEHYVVLQTR